MEQAKDTGRRESNGVYFLSLHLRNVRCFGDEAGLDLSDGNGNWQRWNVLLGDNGTGKTTVLQCLSALELEDYSNHAARLFVPIAGRDLLGNRGIHAQVLAWLTFGTPAEYEQVVFSQTGRDGWGIPPSERAELENFFVIGYGATRFMSYRQLVEQRGRATDTLFSSDARLINAEEWLLQMDYAASKPSEVQVTTTKKRDQIISILKDMLPEVSDIRFSTPSENALIPRVEFQTPFGWVSIQELSLGYKTMVAWIVDVAARMFERYPISPNPIAEPVVILVDEIDLHLHPKWQRKIFDFLTEKFPRAQFIVTAHSPLVVQSAPKDANIILLRQETDEQGNAYVKIDNDVESVRNWRLDQILTSDLFGLESARSPEVEKVLAERKELLQKDELTNEEQHRLKALNAIVQKLPTEENAEDNEAMEIIRKAADYLRKQQEGP